MPCGAAVKVQRAAHVPARPLRRSALKLARSGCAARSSMVATRELDCCEPNVELYCTHARVIVARSALSRIDRSVDCSGGVRSAFGLLVTHELTRARSRDASASISFVASARLSGARWLFHRAVRSLAAGSRALACERGDAADQRAGCWLLDRPLHQLQEGGRSSVRRCLITPPPSRRAPPGRRPSFASRCCSGSRGCALRRPHQRCSASLLTRPQGRARGRARPLLRRQRLELGAPPQCGGRAPHGLCPGAPLRRCPSPPLTRLACRSRSRPARWAPRRARRFRA